MEQKLQGERPHVAIVDTNMLSAVGLKQILQNVIPIMSVDTFFSFSELIASNPDRFFHFFVAMNIVVENRAFFVERSRKTIVLTTSSDPNVQLTGFHCLCVSESEEKFVRSLLMLEQQAHAHGRNLPSMPQALESRILSFREIEVLSLVAQGYLNKEIADQLNIALTTVVSHRKNIVEKLGMKSVSALTIYAVMHGYVDINKI